MSRPVDHLRLERSAALAFALGLLSVGAHAAGGGELPSVATIVVLLGLSFPAISWLGRRRLSRWSTSAFLLCGQVGWHEVLATTGVPAAGRGAEFDAVAMHLAGMTHLHTAGGGTGSLSPFGPPLGSVSDPAVSTIGHGAMAGMTHGYGVRMFAGHLMAAALFGVVLAVVDAVLLWLLSLLARTRLPATALRVGPTSSLRLSPDRRIVIPAVRWCFAVAPTRGPPFLAWGH